MIDIFDFAKLPELLSVDAKTNIVKISLQGCFFVEAELTVNSKVSWLKFKAILHPGVNVVDALAQLEVPSLRVQFPDAGRLNTDRPLTNMEVDLLLLDRHGVFQHVNTLEVLRALISILVSALDKLNLWPAIESFESDGEHLANPAEMFPFNVDVEGHAVWHPYKVKSTLLVCVGDLLEPIRDVCDAGSDHFDLETGAVSGHETGHCASSGRIGLLDNDLRHTSLTDEG